MGQHRLKNICGGWHFSRNHSWRPSPANVLIILKLFSTRRPKWAIRQVWQMLKAVPGWYLQQGGLWNETGEIRPSGEQRRNKKRHMLMLALSWTPICLQHELLCDCGSQASRSKQQVSIQVGLQVIIYSIQVHTTTTSSSSSFPSSSSSSYLTMISPIGCVTLHLFTL